MSVAVAHLPSTTGRLALRTAAVQAVQRRTNLTVIQVADAVDLDVDAARQAGAADEMAAVLKEAEITGLEWNLKVGVSQTEVGDTARTILALATEAGADMLVIGARRRSPVGKLFLGSITQMIILTAEIPVLAVKDPK